MADRQRLAEVFRDTEKWYQENEKLAEAVKRSVAGTVLYMEEDYPEFPAAREGAATKITVTKYRSFEAAIHLMDQYPGRRVAVHNFASATNPGGGVVEGSKAQEESLCRCSTLYPALNTEELFSRYYLFHRNRQDVRYTDACIYTPDVLIIKTDEMMAKRLPESQWRQADILTCAAPNLRRVPYNFMNPGNGLPAEVSAEELFEIHRKRAKHLLTVAAAHKDQILVLGAFGCGAFRNDPQVVAKAYKETLAEFSGVFEHVEFAVFCSEWDKENYEVFRNVMNVG